MRHAFLNLNAQPLHPCYERGYISDRSGMGVPEMLLGFTCSGLCMTVKSRSIDAQLFTMSQTCDVTAIPVGRSGNYTDIEWKSR
jgi:hypothetical protein